MINHLRILLDVLPENKNSYQLKKTFYVLIFTGLFLLPELSAITPVCEGETDFKTYRKAALQKINLQNENIKQDPLDYLSYFELGLAYLALGRHEEEIQAYKEAIKLHSKFAQAHYNLSLAYELLKEGSNAIHHMEKAQELYIVKRDHRKIRSTQRQLKRLYFSYQRNIGTLNSPQSNN